MDEAENAVNPRAVFSEAQGQAWIDASYCVGNGSRALKDGYLDRAEQLYRIARLAMQVATGGAI